MCKSVPIREAFFGVVFELERVLHRTEHFDVSEKVFRTRIATSK